MARQRPQKRNRACAKGLALARSCSVLFDIWNPGSLQTNARRLREIEPMRLAALLLEKTTARLRDEEAGQLVSPTTRQAVAVVRPGTGTLTRCPLHEAASRITTPDTFPPTTVQKSPTEIVRVAAIVRADIRTRGTRHGRRNPGPGPPPR